MTPQEQEFLSIRHVLRPIVVARLAAGGYAFLPIFGDYTEARYFPDPEALCAAIVNLPRMAAHEPLGAIAPFDLDLDLGDL